MRYRKFLSPFQNVHLIIFRKKGFLLLLFLFSFWQIKLSGQINKKADTLYYCSPTDIGLDSSFVFSKIDSIVQMALEEKAFPGCQIIAAKDGAVFFHKTYGFHTFDSITRVKKTDIYDFASVTKITGPLPAIMKLYDEGKLDLDTPFYTYWPDFKRSNKKHLTLRAMLAHQARLTPWIPFWKLTVKKNGKFKRNAFHTVASKKNPVQVAENLYLHIKYKKKIYQSIKKSPLLAETKYRYSGLSFFIYPEMIEKISGTPYIKYLEQNFYKPLGAGSITYTPLAQFKKDQLLPTEYDSIFRKQQIHGYVHDESAAMLGGISGNAGLFGPAIDLAKIMQMYLNGGTYGGKRYLSDSTLKQFTKCQFPENDNRRGLGFDKPLLKNKEKGATAVDASEESFGHVGFTGTFCWADPKNGILFVFMSNRVYPTRKNTKLYQLNIRPSVHQVLYDVAKGIKN